MSSECPARRRHAFLRRLIAIMARRPTYSLAAIATRGRLTSIISNEAQRMNSLMFGCLACLAAFPLFPARVLAAGTVPLDVELKVTDQDYHPLAGVPVRLVFGGPDWQGPDGGGEGGTPDARSAKLTAPAVIDRRWSSVNIGFTPLRMPVRVDHLSLAAEMIFTMPKRE